MEDIFGKLNEMMNKQFSWVGYVDNEDLSYKNDVFKIFLRVATITKRRFYSIVSDVSLNNESRDLFLNKMSENLNPTYMGESEGYMCNDSSYFSYELINYEAAGNIMNINYKTFNKEEFDLVTDLLNNLKK